MRISYFDLNLLLFQFICGPFHIKKVSDKLKEIGYEIQDADEHYLPDSTVSLDDSTLEDLSKALDKINALPEVIKAYDNIE